MLTVSCLFTFSFLFTFQPNLVDVVAVRHRVPAPVEDEPHEEVALRVQPRARLVQHLDLQRVLQRLEYLKRQGNELRDRMSLRFGDTQI